MPIEISEMESSRKDKQKSGEKMDYISKAREGRRAAVAALSSNGCRGRDTATVTPIFKSGRSGKSNILSNF
jgi:hypothetical protein